MDDAVEMIIETMRHTSADNTGVIIEPISVDKGVLRIKYYEGRNDACPECVMPPESFKAMLEAMCSVQAPHITSIEITSARPS